MMATTDEPIRPDANLRSRVQQYVELKRAANASRLVSIER
jgi:hypothetical protein